MAHVEKIRQKKLEVHSKALKEIEKIKGEAQKKHDEINRATKDATDKVTLTASHGILGLDKEAPKYWADYYELLGVTN